MLAEGATTVMRGSKTFMLKESESTFIPAGTNHRLANEGKLPLKIVEIRIGTYFGENDIFRFTNDFGLQANSTGGFSS